MTLYYVGNGGAPAGWNNANYFSLSTGGTGGAGIPTSADDVIIDTNSPDCTLDVAPVVGSLYIKYANSGPATKTFNQNGYDITSVGNVFLDGWLIITLNAWIIIVGDGNYTNTTKGLRTFTNLSIDLRGNNYIYQNAGSSDSTNNLICAYPGKVTTMDSSDTFHRSWYGKLHLMGGEFNSPNYIYLYVVNDPNQFSCEPGSTKTAGGNIFVIFQNTSPLTFNFPGIYYNPGGSSSFKIYKDSSSTSPLIINQQGNIQSFSFIRIYNDSISSMTWNTNNYSLTTDKHYSGGDIFLGNSNAGATTIYNFVNSTITCKELNNTIYNSGSTTVKNYGTTFATDVSPIVWGSNTTLDPTPPSNPPPAPILSSPLNNAINIPPSTTVLWNSSSGADTYRIQVSTVSGFGSTVFDTSGVSSTSQVVNGLTYGITYYWRVNATNTDGTSDWSTIRSFYCNPSITVYARYRGH